MTPEIQSGEQLSKHLDSVMQVLAGSLRILMVDDNPEVLLLMKSFLLEGNNLFAVDAVSSADEADKALQNPTYNLAVIDLYMPTSDVTQNLISRYTEQLPILVVSGKASGGEGYLCSQMNIVGFFDKEMLDQRTLYRAAFDAALKHRLSGIYPAPLYKQKLQSAFNILMSDSPESVSEWAQRLGVSSRALEYSFDCTSRSPRQILKLYRLYRIARAVDTSHSLLRADLTPKDRNLLEYYSAFTNKLKEMVWTM
ncbi:MAG: response regulator [Chitinivibrionales bacterium]|nr:response regulator [Chitinivibrionales bacterium]MBD3358105.1 response regulator [Chitinivibrionales bacterium]